MFKTIKHIHFIGIGGSGMSGIAEVLLNLGYKVTGSDLSRNAAVERLESLGAKIWKGHAAKNVKGANVVVTSTAVSEANPEVKAAHKDLIPVIPRIEMLAELARLKYTIAVAGTHGKTTTTSLVGQVLQDCSMDPTVIVGGRLKAVGTGGVLGNGDYLVAEADESDGSFLKLTPAISIVTNIDNDHMDYYKTEKNLLDAFVQFSEKVPFYGITYLCGDDKGVKRVLKRLTRRTATYGFGKENDLRATNVKISPKGSLFTVVNKGKKLGTVQLSVHGEHNILNALAAVAVGLQLGLPFNKISSALSHFEGVGRRMEVKGEVNGVTVMDDYGHHPTEIRATLSAIRDGWPNGRLFVLFQPHRFSRTKQLYKEFAQALGKANHLYFLPIYPAGEKPLKGVTTELISKRIPSKKWDVWKGEASFKKLSKELKRGDVVLTLGAGNVWKIGEDLIEKSSTLADRVMEAIPSLKGHVKAEESLARHSTWAIGGPAEAYVEVSSVDELVGVQGFCKTNRLPLFILGWGSNLLLPDEGLRGCVVRLRGEFEKIQFRGTTVVVGAGVHLPKLSKEAAARGLSGVEAMAGIPGTVGGAFMTNAGTPRGEIGDVVESVDVLNPDGARVTIPKEHITLRYRESNLMGRLIVSATLNLTPTPNGTVKEAVQKELDLRKKTQPLGTKNVGSVFRNPQSNYAGKLIEAVGLKGKKVGNVRFSPKHANFMENTGGATAKEAMDLIQLARRLVKKKFNVDLHPEVKIVKPHRF